MQAVEDEAGLDGLAQAYLVGQQHARSDAAADLIHDEHLMREQIHAPAGKAAHGAALHLAAPLQRLGAQLRSAQVVDLAGEEAVLRFAEADGVGQLRLGYIGLAAMINDEAGPLLDAGDGEALAGVGLQRVALLEAHPAQRGGFHGVLPQFIGRGEKDFHPPVFDLQDDAQAEVSLRFANPALSRNRCLHFSRSRGGQSSNRNGTGNGKSTPDRISIVSRAPAWLNGSMIVTSRQAFGRLRDEIGTVDQVGVEERVAKFTTRSIKKQSKLFGLRLAVTMVDLTTLEGKDTPGKVASLCQKAVCPHPGSDIPPVAAVCVYPSMVRHARRALGDGAMVRIASVATAFPSGQAPLKTRLAEVRAAVAAGADEIDMVINRGAFLAGEFSRVQDEIAQVVEACGPATLKVILETSELETYDNIRAASFIAMRVLRPGDFIKTSTGKTSANATLGNNQVMLEAIRDFYLDTGIPIAMKPAGGIRTAKQALHFLIAVKETLGDEWLNNRRYRFGASSLLNDLVRQIEKERTGAYQAPWYFSEAAEAY